VLDAYTLERGSAFACVNTVIQFYPLKYCVITTDQNILNIQ